MTDRAGTMRGALAARSGGNRGPRHAARRLVYDVVLAQAGRLVPFTFSHSATTFWGAAMRVHPPEPVSNRILVDGYHELDQTRYFIDTVQPGQTVLDIGAHFGYFALLAAALVGEEGAVHAFEPTPTTRAILTRNVAGIGCVRVHEQAVSSGEGVIELLDLGVKYSAWNSVHRPRLSERRLAMLSPHVQRVPTVSVDAFCAAEGVRPDFVKIDAESAEGEILDGMRETLSSARPPVTLEVGDRGVPGVATSAELCERMRALGYDALVLGPDGLVRYDPLALAERYENVLFLHP